MLRSILACAIIADILERRFPEGFQRFLVESSYNCIYLFSKLQIFLSNTKQTVNTFIDNNSTLSKIKKDMNELMKPGIVVMTEFIKDGKSVNLFTSDNNSDSYDFAIISWLDESKKYINKKLVYDKAETKVAMAELSDIKFMLVEIKIGDNEPHKIDLKNDEFNYYLVGNKFTSKFFNYYLRKHLNIEDEELLAKLEEDFVVKIIDHKVDTVEIKFVKNSPNDFIEIQKEGYGFRGTELKKEEIKESKEM